MATKSSEEVNLMLRLKHVERRLMLTVVVSMLLCFYALHVELRTEYDGQYSPLCDINSIVSCSKPFTSQYAVGFGLLPQSISYKNPIYGVAFYTVFIIVSFNFGHHQAWLCKITLAMAIMANCMSLYLGYILVYKLQAICLVCCCTYLTNIALLAYSYRRHEIVQQIISSSIDKTKTN